MAAVILGVTIIVLFFAGVFAVMAQSLGAKMALLILGFSVAVTAVLTGASLLISYGLTGSLS